MGREKGSEQVVVVGLSVVVFVGIDVAQTSQHLNLPGKGERCIRKRERLEKEGGRQGRKEQVGREKIEKEKERKKERKKETERERERKRAKE